MLVFRSFTDDDLISVFTVLLDLCAFSVKNDNEINIAPEEKGNIVLVFRNSKKVVLIMIFNAFLENVFSPDNDNKNDDYKNDKNGPESRHMRSFWGSFNTR